ncbi:VOC family protein [Parvibaculum sp.]|uniref:VOC family protein n=1 Tax=Parvibaculum sp. TaxID=2024848 RepID=UPI001D302847|nr:VOC family protein [Parvibaculum sp.]MBX3491287.1 VOC family protein [Parvibaculum sp.]
MAGSVNSIPDNGAPKPYICVSRGNEAIAFYRQVFDAVETLKISDPAGKVGHAELTIGEGSMMLCDEFPEYGALSPETIGGSPVVLHIYVKDADATVAKAEAAGATILKPVEDQFYGDRGGKLKDPFGHIWWVSTRIEDISHDEMRRRAKELYGMS